MLRVDRRYLGVVVRLVGVTDPLATFPSDVGRWRASRRDGSLGLIFTFLLLMTGASCRGAHEPIALDEALAADWTGLAVEVVSGMPDDRLGGRLVVFLHGYGSQGRDHEPVARALADERTRVALPTAVLPHANGFGAIWWEFIEGDWPKPYSDDPTANAWPKPSRQLPKARAAIVDLIARLRARYQPEVTIVAGHSQGAMLALDVATIVEPPVEGVAALAGYVLLDSVPAIERPRTRRMPVLVSHGRRDETVGFDAAERMRGLLVRNGFEVRFRPHDGGHGMEAAVVAELRAFVAGTGARP